MPKQPTLQVCLYLAEKSQIPDIVLGIFWNDCSEFKYIPLSPPHQPLKLVFLGLAAACIYSAIWHLQIFNTETQVGTHEHWCQGSIEIPNVNQEKPIKIIN